MKARADSEVSRIAGLLDRCLADDELRTVAAAAVVALGREASVRLRPLLAADTWATLERVVGPRESTRGGSGHGRVVPGADRVRQDWDRHLQRWDACVVETSDEKGEYIEQEHDWECPYFDVDRFAEDLDRIAGDMEPLIPLMIEYGLESDFSFLEKLEESALDVGSGLPEWMENLGGTGLAGAALSRCLLQWERLSGRQAGEHADTPAAFGFLDRLRLAEEGASGWSFCYGAVPAFVASLPVEEQKGILAGLSGHRHEAHWAGDLANPGSGWFQMLEQLLARFAPEEHAGLLRRSVSRDWRLALPLLEEALGAVDDSGWEETITAAVPGLVGPRDGDPWNPDRTLLITRKGHAWFSDAEAKEVERFLGLWADLLRKGGRPAEAAVLDVQQQVWRAWGDWDRVLDAFHRAATTPGAADTAPLFDEWRHRVTERSRPNEGFRLASPEVAASWVPLLVDAARVGRDDKAAFQEALRNWLSLAGRDAEAFRRARRWLEVLTSDLDSDLKLASDAPFLHRALGWLRQESVQTRSRQTWLRRFDAASLRSEILAAWRTAPEQLILDPGCAKGSHYEDHACWLGVVFDLDPAFFRRTIRSWRLEHGRRRNLWKAIRTIGLPLDD